MCDNKEFKWIEKVGHFSENGNIFRWQRNQDFRHVALQIREMNVFRLSTLFCDINSIGDTFCQIVQKYVVDKWNKNSFEYDLELIFTFIQYLYMFRGMKQNPLSFLNNPRICISVNSLDHE